MTILFSNAVVVSRYLTLHFIWHFQVSKIILYLCILSSY